MLCLWPELEEDESESEADDCVDDVELEDPKWWLVGLADMVKVGRRRRRGR
jgi:hypothetical protein